MTNFKYLHMTTPNKTFIEKSIQDLSRNLKKCATSVKKCCEITYEKMHYELNNKNRKQKLKRKGRYKKLYRYRDLNMNYQNHYCNDNFGLNYRYSRIMDNNNKIKYNGLENIWLTRKSIEFFKNIDPMKNTINILKCSIGYCLISRTCKKYNVQIKYCYDLNGEELTNKSPLKKDDIIQCKLPTWKKSCVCKVYKIKKNYEGEIFLDLLFPSCPESEIMLGWHFNNSINKNKTLLNYNNIKTNKQNERTNTERKMQNTKHTQHAQHTKHTQNNLQFKILNDVDKLEPISEEKEKNTIGAFILDDLEENEIISNEIYDEKTSKEEEPLFENLSSNFVKYSESNEILKYNVLWANDFDIYDKKLFKRKQIVVSSKEHVDNIHTSYLSNVKIISEHHMKNIINIHQHSKGTLKMIRLNKKKHVNMLEPQTLEFFKYNRYYSRIASALSCGIICSFTGVLSENAKKYLFNIL